MDSKTYQPLLTITIKSNVRLPAFRFVNYSGALCTLNSKSIGVTEREWLANKPASVVALGTVTVEAAESISIGDNIASAADGKAKTAEIGDIINGRAVDSAQAGGLLKIMLIQ